MMSMDGSAAIAVMHDDHRYAMFGDHPRDVAVVLQAPHVVDDRGAGLDRPSRHLGLHGIDRDRNAERYRGGEDRREALHFPIERHRDGSRRRDGSTPRRYPECRRLRPPSGRLGQRRSEGSRKRPPSENKSGVTLSTPITSGRSSVSRCASERGDFRSSRAEPPTGRASVMTSLCAGPWGVSSARLFADPIPQ